MIIFLTGFKTMEEWRHEFNRFSFNERNIRAAYSQKHVIFIFKRTSILMINKQLYYFYENEKYEILSCSLPKLPQQHPTNYRELYKKISEKNMCIPTELWPPLSQTVPWEIYHERYQKENNHTKKNLYISFDHQAFTSTSSFEN